MGYGYSRYPRYVPVAERRTKIEKKIKNLKKKGDELHPVTITTRSITQTFWGKSWCKNLEGYSDFDSRLPRGRSYVRNGAVIDLKVYDHGEIKALVQGSRLYKVSISIKPCDDGKWQKLVAACGQKIDSLIELLQGVFSKAVMEIITDKESGLFPKPAEITFLCSCPDWASMCKHVAAALYGFGERLDETPQELFKVRQVNHLELMSSATALTAVAKTEDFKTDELSALFDIEIEQEEKTDKKKSVKAVKKPAKKTKESVKAAKKPEAKKTGKPVKKDAKK